MVTSLWVCSSSTTQALGSLFGVGVTPSVVIGETALVQPVKGIYAAGMISALEFGEILAIILSPAVAGSGHLSAHILPIHLWKEKQPLDLYPSTRRELKYPRAIQNFNSIWLDSLSTVRITIGSLSIRTAPMPSSKAPGRSTA